MHTYIQTDIHTYTDEWGMWISHHLTSNIHTYIHTYIHTQTNGGRRSRAPEMLCSRLQQGKYACTDMFVLCVYYMYIHTCIHIYTYLPRLIKYICMYTHIYVHIHTCMYVCKCVYIYIYIYIYIV